MEKGPMTVTVDLPPDLAEFVREEAATYGTTDAAEYIRRLVNDAQRGKELHRLESLLSEGLQASYSDVSEEDWNELRSLAAGVRSPGVR